MTDRDAAAVEKAVQRLEEEWPQEAEPEDMRDVLAALRREWREEWEREKLTAACPECGTGLAPGQIFISSNCDLCQGTGRVPIEYTAAVEIAEFMDDGAMDAMRGDSIHSPSEYKFAASKVRDYARSRWLEPKEAAP